MICAISSSSPLVSVALFDECGSLIWSAEEESKMRASEVLVRLLERSPANPLDSDRFVVDVGPGSFIGVRVGVVFAKMISLRSGILAGVASFDLVSQSACVVIPSKKGEYFIRNPGMSPQTASSLPVGAHQGYGEAVANQIFPHASQTVLKDLVFLHPAVLLPNYVNEPSISTPKQPFPGGPDA